MRMPGRPGAGKRAVLSESKRRALFNLAESTVAKALSFLCLIIALFANGCWQVFDVPDDPGNLLLDLIMSIVAVFFITEIIVGSIADRNYFCSFFFFMDTLGTISMIFEISFLLGPAGKPSEKNAAVDPTLMRAARIAKMAARSGRVMKLTKCLSMIIPKTVKGMDEDDTLSILSSKLGLSVSTKASLLTIIVVCLLPAFSLDEYPSEDLSLRMWARRTEIEYGLALRMLESDPKANASSRFADVVRDMVAFYDTVDYFPYEMTGYKEQLYMDSREVRIPGALRLASEDRPRRIQNSLVMHTADCQVVRDECNDNLKASVVFNFTKPKRVEAFCDMGLSMFVVFVMCAASINISSVVESLIFPGLRRMVGLAKETSWKVLSIGETSDRVSRNNGYDFTLVGSDDTTLLELALAKLMRLAEVAMQRNEASQDGISAMEREEIGILVEMMRTSVRGVRRSIRGSTSSHTTQASAPLVLQRISDVDKFQLVASSWSWDALTEPKDQVDRMCVYIVLGPGIMSHGHDAQWVEETTFMPFLRDIMASYADLPYHNAMHAVDILFTVYRLMPSIQTTLWMSSVEVFAMFIAALGHDAAHLGQTNQFLIETRHLIALKFNDVSPLENLHCATLFRIAQRVSCDIFTKLSRDDFKEVRNTIVLSILHTDNAHHFDMVKELQTTYEVNSEICEAEMQEGRTNINESDRKDFLRQHAALLKKFLLHAADISNATKPFKICAAWADRALEEFFNQGDLEKELGLPVGMLNDRDRVNRPTSQHGFINFLVSPLMFAGAKLFPAFHPITTQMASNVQSWCLMWVAEQPTDTKAIEQRKQEVQKIMSHAEELALRGTATRGASAASSEAKERPTERTIRGSPSMLSSKGSVWSRFRSTFRGSVASSMPRSKSSHRSVVSFATASMPLPYADMPPSTSSLSPDDGMDGASSRPPTSSRRLQAYQKTESASLSSSMSLGLEVSSHVMQPPSISSAAPWLGKGLPTPLSARAVPQGVQRI